MNPSIRKAKWISLRHEAVFLESFSGFLLVRNPVIANSPRRYIMLE